MAFEKKYGSNDWSYIVSDIDNSVHEIYEF